MPPRRQFRYAGPPAPIAAVPARRRFGVGFWVRPRSPLVVAAAVALWITLFANLALWRALIAISPGPGGVAVALLVGVVLFAVHMAVLALAASAPAIRVAGILAVLAAAVAQHFTLRFGIVIDAGLAANVLATDGQEAGDLIGASFAFDLVAVAALPVAWLATVPIRRRGVWRDAARGLAAAVAFTLLAGLLTAASFRILAPMVRNHLELRLMPNPISPIVSFVRAALRPAHKPVATVLTATFGARLGTSHAAVAAGTARPPLVVLVVGETARADHFGLNGYARDTTPELAARGVTSFTDVRSCGTHTAASVPCMFSPLGKAGYRHDAPETGNLLDVVQAAGMAVLWVDNQAGCKDVCDRVASASTRDLAGSGAAARLCGNGGCLDEALLQGLDQRIAALPEAARRNGVLVVLHQMGSHGPAYGRRSPADRKRWFPECTTLVLGDCAPGELVNAYDNSIAYTDHVLAATIDWLQARSTAWAPAMLYVSDHGESLGEFGVFLHGLPEMLAPKVQTHVPMVAWLGDAIAERDRVDRSCLARARARPLSHDNLYHSVLGLLDVATPTYRADLDLAAPCRATR